MFGKNKYKKIEPQPVMNESQVQEQPAQKEDELSILTKRLAELQHMKEQREQAFNPYLPNQEANVDSSSGQKERLPWAVREIPTQTTKVILNTETGETIDIMDALVEILNILNN